MSNEYTDWLNDNRQTKNVLTTKLSDIIHNGRFVLPKELYNLLVVYRRTLISELEDWTPFKEDVKCNLVSELETIMDNIQWEYNSIILKQLQEFLNTMNSIL